MRRITLVLVTVIVVFASVSVQAQPRVVADAGQYSLPAMALLIAAVHDDGDGVIDLMQSLSVALAATWSLKVIVDAKRPNGGGRSFPSAHTTVAFASATHIWKRYGWKWGAPAAVAATTVASHGLIPVTTVYEMYWWVLPSERCHPCFSPAGE